MELSRSTMTMRLGHNEETFMEIIANFLNGM